MVSQQVRMRRYDIIHFHYPYDEGLGVIFAAKMFNIPTVATIFGGMIVEASERNPKTIPFLRYVINNTDAPFSITEISRKVTLNLGGIEKFIRVIPVGVDYEKYSSFEVEKKEFRRNLGISDDERVVLLVGPEFDKGIVESLINLSEKLGIRDRVIFTGEVSEEFLISCYKVSDLLVSYPRTQITTAIMPVVEAVASGITVVAASIGALSEYIIDGKNGFLIKPNEPEVLAEKIMDIMTNPKNNKIDRSIARQKFSWSVISKRFIEIYMNLIETKRRK
jgi:glycosyltransferase involved in cell wall biosynthesis